MIFYKILLILIAFYVLILLYIYIFLFNVNLCNIDLILHKLTLNKKIYIYKNNN